MTAPRHDKTALLADVTELIGIDYDKDTMGSGVVESVVDALVDLSILVLPERFDEECHACERRVGDHAVDGRCPA